MDPRAAPADDVGAPRALAAPHRLRARDPRDARRRRARARPRRRARRARRACCCCTARRAARTRCTRRGSPCSSARAGWRGTVLNFRSCARDPRDIRVRLRNRRAAPLPRRRHGGPRSRRARAARARARGAALRDRLLAGRRRAAQVARRAGPRRARDARSRRPRRSPRPTTSRPSARFLERRAARASTSTTSCGASGPRRSTSSRASPRRRPTSTASASARARTIREFDDCATAPLHGFAGADDYYARASTLPHLPRIRVPTLCMSGADDPFYPGRGHRAARARRRRPDVTFAVTAWGGHTGFVTGRWPWRPVYWAEEAAIAWLAAHGAVTNPTNARR